MRDLEGYSKETDVAVLRSLFGAVPIVGGLLNEIVFDIRGRIKQERLNRFTELLSEYFSGEPKFDVNALKTEDFSDLFEAVLRNVVQTKSNAKHKRYRDILINGIEGKVSDLDGSNRFLELVASLEEIEIMILSCHKVFDEKFIQDRDEYFSATGEASSLKQKLSEEMKLSSAGSANDKDKISNELEVVKSIISKFESYLDKIEIFKSAEFYEIDAGRFLYYKQNLYSKALLIDINTGRMDHVQFENMGITEFGKEFLDFLKKA